MVCYKKYHISAYSAYGAFFLLLSAVPMAMLFVGVVDLVGDILWLDILPQYGSYFGKSGYTLPIVSFSALFLLWSASRGVRGIVQGMEAIFGTRHSFVGVLVRSAVYTFVIVGVVALSFVVLVLASPLEQLVAKLLGRWSAVVLGVLNLRNIIFFLSLSLLFALAFKNLAPNSIPFRRQLVGGAFASAGWIAVSFGFSVYVKYFSRYPALYGSFGGVMVFMLWLYICVNILLCGAMVNRIFFGKM